MTLPDELVALLRTRAIAYVATTMPDGSPQITQTWIDTDGERLLVNIVQGSQKSRNLERDPRVAVTVSDPAHPTQYWQVRGSVEEMTTDGAVESIEGLAQKYLGRSYPWYGGREQVRVLLKIGAERIGGVH